MIKITKGAVGKAAKLFGKSDGKGARAQSLHAPAHGGFGLGGPSLGAAAQPSITPGDPMSRAMGQYGKGHSYLNGADMPAAASTTPTLSHPGASQIRGGAGGMKSRPRSGGLGDDKAQAPTTPMDD